MDSHALRGDWKRYSKGTVFEGLLVPLTNERDISDSYYLWALKKHADYSPKISLKNSKMCTFRAD